MGVVNPYIILCSVIHDATNVKQAKTV